jgi:hypothetical protein
MKQTKKKKKKKKKKNGQISVCKTTITQSEIDRF